MVNDYHLCELVKGHVMTNYARCSGKPGSMVRGYCDCIRSSLNRKVNNNRKGECVAMDKCKSRDMREKAQKTKINYDC